MAYLTGMKYYYKKEDIPHDEKVFLHGWDLLNGHTLLSQLRGKVIVSSKYQHGSDSAASVASNGTIYVNVHCKLRPEQWFFVLAHALLHLAFGHFDRDHIPGDVYTSPDASRRQALWNKACDLYITQFLIDIHAGCPLCEAPGNRYPFKMSSEETIYKHLLALGEDGLSQNYGTASVRHMDMVGLEHPVQYAAGEQNPFIITFEYMLAHLSAMTVMQAGGHLYDETKNTPALQAARWFMGYYPLLGSMASSYKIIEDVNFCIRNEIEIAAIDAVHGELYINPACGFSEEEWKFVIAHEFLHAGLMHHKRAQGRDLFLWNVACDYVINGWLVEMQIGKMPEKGLLYDKALCGMSAEAIYDRIRNDLRKISRLDTFRGYHKGDILTPDLPSFQNAHEGIPLDEFYKNSLREGLDYHISQGRGSIPAGLLEEIRALSMPAIPWDVELARWFDTHFPPLEKRRTYARPSRRQSSTPDIPRPRAVLQENDDFQRTFGVIIDTSGSVSSRMLAMALGSIASYGISKEVAFVRVIFCDADAYDAGYLSTEDIAGRVEIKGRGGTILQPAVTLLEQAKDFPADGPILIITDGMIDEKLSIHREHAYLLPKGAKLPFQPKGSIFYFE